MPLPSCSVVPARGRFIDGWNGVSPICHYLDSIFVATSTQFYVCRWSAGAILRRSSPNAPWARLLDYKTGSLARLSYGWHISPASALVVSDQIAMCSATCLCDLPGERRAGTRGGGLWEQHRNSIFDAVFFVFSVRRTTLGGGTRTKEGRVFSNATRTQVSKGSSLKSVLRGFVVKVCACFGLTCQLWGFDIRIRMLSL